MNTKLHLTLQDFQYFKDVSNDILDKAFSEYCIQDYEDEDDFNNDANEKARELSEIFYDELDKEHYSKEELNDIRIILQVY